jgi:hypothetical protein
MQAMLGRFCKRDLNLNLVLYHLLRSFISHLFISMQNVPERSEWEGDLPSGAVLGGSHLDSS